ncbi:S1 RNA-binding domain-containing protein [Clostridium thailandense]|uniref:CvfB family protein n=1 Tax=Clostridium thailandense TaxID=2794346 RepID=UPI003988F902
MIKIGDFNKLKIVRRADFGYYLDAGTGNTSDDVLLPNKSALGKALNIDDEVEAFIYRDSKDRIIATLKRPLATVGELAYLKVVSTTKIGSFVDFGLERDILVPFKEKLYGLQNNKFYLFYIYLDKTGRIAATTDIDRHLEDTDKYASGDHVKGIVYGFQTNKSAMVAVDNMYRGVILKHEYFSEINPGDVLDLTVLKIYEDGKLGLTPRKSGKIERTELQDSILEYLKAHDNFMPFNDKSSPEKIYDAFHVSKNNFKNALGGLMKRNLIVQDENGTKLK